jgi:hypothetical protein
MADLRQNEYDCSSLRYMPLILGDINSKFKNFGTPLGMYLRYKSAEFDVGCQLYLVSIYIGA